MTLMPINWLGQLSGSARDRRSMRMKKIESMVNTGDNNPRPTVKPSYGGVQLLRDTGQP